MDKHNPLLDEFPELVEVLRRVCSREAFTYVTEDIRPRRERYLDDAFAEDPLEILRFMAHDQKEAKEIENPPARVKLAVHRNMDRRKAAETVRFTPLEDVNGTPKTGMLFDPDNPEASAITQVDWHRAQKDLGIPPDQVTAVNAKLKGLGLNANETAEYLGWDRRRLDRARKSLGPDRKLGRILRERFAAYRNTHTGRQDWKDNPEPPRTLRPIRTGTGFGDAKWDRARKKWWFEFKAEYGGDRIGPFHTLEEAVAEAKEAFEAASPLVFAPERLDTETPPARASKQNTSCKVLMKDGVWRVPPDERPKKKL